MDQSLEFSICINDNENPVRSSYELMGLLCYPLSKQSGDMVYSVKLMVYVDGELHLNIVQSQHGVSDISQLDLDIIKYFFQQCVYDKGEDLDFVRETLKEESIVKREIKITLNATQR